MSSTLLLEKNEMARILDRLASQVLERHARCENVMLVGIQRRGADPVSYTHLTLPTIRLV